MKLKKIASLALAGIMAVSMLAGCKDGTSQVDPSSSSQVPVASNAVTYANNQLTSAQKKIFEFEDDESVNAALKAITANYDKIDSDNIHNTYNSFSVTGGWNQLTDVTNALKDKLNKNDFISNPKDNFKLTATGMHKYAAVYMVSGKYNEEAAVAAAVNAYSNGNTNTNPSKVIDAYYPLSATGFEANYDAAISAVKMTNPQENTESAWVIAIVVTQTVSSVANS